jgi:hypothetical protein
MRSRRLLAAATVPQLFLFLSLQGWAQDLPNVRIVTQGPGTELSVQFDRPVDHIHSCLIVGRDGRVVELLNPRLGAQPDVLFGRMPALRAGDYKLYWTMPAQDGSTTLLGGIPFTIRAERDEARSATGPR